MPRHKFKNLNSILSSLGISSRKFTPTSQTTPTAENTTYRKHTTKREQSELFDFLALIKKWDDIIGQRIAQNSIPLKLTRGTLHVLTNHAAYSSVISFMEEKIKENIITYFPSLIGKVDNIKFQVNSAFFEKQKAIGMRSKVVKTLSTNQPMHLQSPAYKKLKKEADSIFQDVSDKETKEALTSIFFQNRNRKEG